MNRIKTLLIVLAVMFFSESIKAKQECAIYDSDDSYVKKCNIKNEDFSNLEDGYYKLVIYALDAAGNKQVAKSNEFIIDNNPPQITYKKEKNKILIYAKDTIDTNPKISFILNGKTYNQNYIVLNDISLLNVLVDVYAVDEALNETKESLDVQVNDGVVVSVSEKENTTDLKTKKSKKNPKWLTYLNSEQVTLERGNFEIVNLMYIKFIITILLFVPIIFLAITFYKTKRMVEDVSAIL